MRKSTFRICENKDADQLHCNRKADQRLCFRYINSTIPLLFKSEISSLYPSSVAAQPGFCGPGRKPECWFSYVAAHMLFQGKQFCIWKLSDLKDCDKTITFFLFGNVYKEHWKNDTGTVIGLLNATMMDKSEKVSYPPYYVKDSDKSLLVPCRIDK